jgi:redox-sensitive bicupin YhaK (pirin superfamily)
MSIRPCAEPAGTEPDVPAIDMVIDERPRDLGGFMVGRVLPHAHRRLLGPFIFFDHMGMAEMAPGTALDVRPHPHIHLATVTYLFEGEIAHRDSLGTHQTIRPGAINWMTAGRGIVHSERTPPGLRQTGHRLHGLQLWVALPKEHEDIAPEFDHYAADAIPSFEDAGVRVRILAGSAYGVASPVRTLSPLFYVEAFVPEGGELALPDEHEERAVYVVSGEVSSGIERAPAGRMLVFTPGARVVLRAEEKSHVMLLGGATLDGPRHIYWNFVSSSADRIEQAKADWREGRFPKVPGDDQEFIPLPDEPSP